jgi:hypothetical protein
LGPDGGCDIEVYIFHQNLVMECLQGEENFGIFAALTPVLCFTFLQLTLLFVVVLYIHSVIL